MIFKYYKMYIKRNVYMYKKMFTQINAMGICIYLTVKCKHVYVYLIEIYDL